MMTEYRGYEIQAVTTGGYQIYLNGKSMHVISVQSVKEGKRIIDGWFEQKAYAARRFCL